MQRTLKRELKVLETVEREALEASECLVGIGWKDYLFDHS